MNEEPKRPWKSKTHWAALIVALVSFYPPVGDWVGENKEMFMVAVGVLFSVLRSVTKGRVSIS